MIRSNVLKDNRRHWTQPSPLARTEPAPKWRKKQPTAPAVG